MDDKERFSVGKQDPVEEEIGEGGEAEILDPLLQFRTNILGRVLFLFIIQLMLTALIFIDAIWGNSDDTPWSTYPATVWIIMARFICGMVMHVSLKP